MPIHFKDSGKKNSLGVKSKKEVICWNGLPMSTKAQDFINKSLVVICQQGHLTYSVYQEEPQIEVPTLDPTCLCVLVNHCRKTLVSSVYSWTETCHVQAQLHKLYLHLHLYPPIRTAWFRLIKIAHETTRIGTVGRKVLYKRWPPPLSWKSTILVATWICVSWEAVLLIQINAFIITV